MADAAKNENATHTTQDRRTTWETEDAYWRENHASRPYAQADRGYDDYQPAYRYGCEAHFTYADRPWDDTVEMELKLGWPQARGSSTMEWDQVREAVKAAYERACRV